MIIILYLERVRKEARKEGCASETKQSSNIRIPHPRSGSGRILSAGEHNILQYYKKAVFGGSSPVLKECTRNMNWQEHFAV